MTKKVLDRCKKNHLLVELIAMMEEHYQENATRGYALEWLIGEAMQQYERAERAERVIGELLV